MTDYIWTERVARQVHRCSMCSRVILPGEPYQRCAGLERSGAWSYKYCDHCTRVASTWSRHIGEYEWDLYHVVEWLSEEFPAVYAALRAGWRYPDGELLPLPFQRRCMSCGTLLSPEGLWCGPCDTKRIERITASLVEISNTLKTMAS